VFIDMGASPIFALIEAKESIFVAQVIKFISQYYISVYRVNR